ncbi:MAG: transcription antitermination protein NusB [Clostridiales bacterium]|jgi:N utilization substance protein B|nr:transcription antitermination protein NusB [Clostridiales bacterium]
MNTIRAREYAFLFQCQHEIANKKNQSISESMGLFFNTNGVYSAYRDWISLRIICIENYSGEITSTIAELSKKWKENRISKIVMAGLKLAIAEVKFVTDDTPNKVVVSEVIDLIAKYGSKEEANFANGILANLLKDEKK